MGTAPKAPRAPAPPPPPPACKVGDVVLDRYRVIEQIASGGHSIVYRGQDERLSRPVCIKVFSGLGGKSGLGRTSYEHFVQEAFALSRLTHPNTLRIYDFGHLGAKDLEGMPLQVCEYMNGGTLSQVIREQGRQPLAETVRVTTAMCAALGEAHGLGIVHRDIKPQNILFGAVGGSRLPKLADFGIAKWSVDESGPETKRAEDTAIVAGQKLAMYSPSWAAPEQLAGQPVSAATDIYSLAVVAIYMLTGKAIFADEDVYAGYKKRRTADGLIQEALAQVHVPRGVIALLTRALAFDPKKRLGKVEELASELTVALEPSTEEVPRLPPPAPSTTEFTAPFGYQLATPTVPHQAVTPPAGMPTAPPPEPAAQPVKVWQPPVVCPPWMQAAAAPTGAPQRLPLAEMPQPVGDRNVHFVLATTSVVDLVGAQAQKVRITFINGKGGVRLLHVKGMTCFVAHLGGRPSPAVQLDQPGDLALVTPRAQEIGHIRVASGSREGSQMVFPVGNRRVAVHLDDCTDPILFDFGPGSEAYFVYTQGRAIPRTRRR